MLCCGLYSSWHLLQSKGWCKWGLSLGLWWRDWLYVRHCINESGGPCLSGPVDACALIVVHLVLD